LILPRQGGIRFYGNLLSLDNGIDYTTFQSICQYLFEKNFCILQNYLFFNIFYAFMW